MNKAVRPWLKPQGGKGKRKPATEVAASLLRETAPLAVRVLVHHCRLGDVNAAKEILSRTMPQRRGAPVQFELPKLETAADLASAIGSIIEATSKGKLTPDEAAIITQLLDTQRRAIEAVDIETRLQAVEQQLAEDAKRDQEK